ncbi:MAG: cation transporter [Gammaproteobacteria bacterium]|uniref:cation transporter n=1 Tax=Limnobacter sp. TaxID=2003368 RepID=UPI001E04B071|nr:cation transporter [Limnobacter sp.]MBU0785131.1 cation transporter [Gammaproteobacteria bacterium]MBU0849169.1 cation transporter [Gammaproteobacteria bacterium]MBU1267920.1 cation transporter [Gammaproteobacteria bacterium]MBU1528325.1 cation transporter [Gammaproteobacteria bacterium]MBU1781506.1 cation transporter [Gammaproteobacteria bacterium]
MPGCNHCPADEAAKSTAVDAGFRKVLWIALISNAVMFFVEVGASWQAGSVSLLADSLDFGGDAANYALSLFVLGMAIQTRAKAALLKGVCMGLYGVGVLGFALYVAFQGNLPAYATMGVVAVLALVVNVGVAALQYRYRNGDSNMRSVWLCSRNDAIGNIAVLCAAVLVGLTQAAWPDLLVAALMASLGLSSSVSVIRQARSELT